MAIARQRGHPDGVVECRDGGGRNGAWPSALSGTCRHGKIGSGFPADKRSSRGCLDPSFFLEKNGSSSPSGRERETCGGRVGFRGDCNR